MQLSLFTPPNDTPRPLLNKARFAINEFLASSFLMQCSIRMLNAGAATHILFSMFLWIPLVGNCCRTLASVTKKTLKLDDLWPYLLPGVYLG